MPVDGMSLFMDGCLITRTPRGWTIAWLRFLWRFGLCSGRRVNQYGMGDRYFDDRVRKTLERLGRAQSSRVGSCSARRAICFVLWDCWLSARSRLPLTGRCNLRSSILARPFPQARACPSRRMRSDSLPPPSSREKWNVLHHLSLWSFLPEISTASRSGSAQRPGTNARSHPQRNRVAGDLRWLVVGMGRSGRCPACSKNANDETVFVRCA